jgi:hypothetical protein
MSTTPRLWKYQTQVNTSDAAYPGRGGDADQGHPKIAGLPDGGYVVVWEDDSRTHNPAGSAIVGQKYDSAGNKVGGEVKISQFVDGNQFSPAVTVLPNGNIAVAFVDVFSNDYDVYVRVFDSSLKFVRQDNIDTGANQTFDPSITGLADGGYAITYTLQNSVSDTDIVARIVSPTGTVGGQFDIDNQTDKRNFSEVATLANGNFVAVYQDQVAGSPTNTDILFKVLTAVGTPVAAASGTVPGAGGPGETEPDVAALRGGGFVVVWTDRYSIAPGDTVATPDIRASILSNTGGTVASNIVVNTSRSGVQHEASVVALADGGFMVSWEDANVALVRGQRFDVLGNKIGAEFIMKSGPAPLSGPDAALLADGRIALTSSDDSGSDLNVATSIWTLNGRDAIGAVGVAAAGDLDGNGLRDYIWRDANADMTKWEYAATTQQVSQVDLGTIGFSWHILASDRFAYASPVQMLTQNVDDGTMTLWWVSNGQQLTGVNIGQHWQIDYIANGRFTDLAGVTSNFLVTNTADHHLYDWWIDSNYKLQGIDLGAAWSNIKFVATGEFTPYGKTDFLVTNTVDHHLYDWWIDAGTGTLQGVDLGAAWNNVGYIASGKFTANGGGNDNLLVFNQGDHHLYDWWIDPTSRTLQGVDLGAAWSNIAFVTSGHFDNHTSNEELLVRNTVDSHLYEWWIDPTSHALTGIDLGAHPGIELIDRGHFNNANGSAINDELLVHNTADGHLYEWWIANNKLSGVDLMI